MILKLLKPIGWLIGYLRFKEDRLRLKKLIKRGLKVGGKDGRGFRLEVIDNKSFCLKRSGPLTSFL